MKNLLTLLVLVFSCPALSAESFPATPHEDLTPGSLCDKPDSKRYPEGIPYCSRSVSSEKKREVMRHYDAQLGYRLSTMERALFKIDHYIPLCMGGSNRHDNLWPQHVSVYEITDPLEQYACEKMAAGKLLQADAIEMIRRAKADLSAAPGIIRQVRGL